ncbi:MAG: hypothetical protein QGI09_02690, partial [Dehalococcoidia bacterium]|nr:hypothetical protein [Dehalococcoidia bacterium]
MTFGAGNIPARVIMSTSQETPAQKSGAATGSPASVYPVDASIDDLKSTALRLRRDIVSMIAQAGSGHPGGSLSAVEILTSLYLKVMRHDSSNPRKTDRDRFILSKAHAC